MRKENRVVITYLDSLLAGINKAKKQISKCEPTEISGIFETLYKEVDNKKADKVEEFINNLSRKNANRR